MEPGGPGGRGASCTLKPQIISHIPVLICGFVHVGHTGITFPFLTPSCFLLYFIFGPPGLYLVLVFLLLFISQQFPPPSHGILLLSHFFPSLLLVPSTLS